MKKYLKEFMSTILQIFIACLIIIMINTFIIQPTQVKGTSMESTLHDKNRIFINKLPHTFNQKYDYEDIVVIDSRKNHSRTLMDDIFSNLKMSLIIQLFTKKQDDFYWIKRIVGKEGDIIEFKNGYVIKNGEIIKETYTNQKTNYYREKRIIVPENYVYVLGDNRRDSKDSRHIGCIPVDNILGKYWFTLF